MPFDPKHLERFPTDPGVYLMKNQKQEVIYVGKAKHLKKRVKQYFAKSPDNRAMIPYLVKEIDHIETIVVETEKEALLVENTLIKKHQPKFNAFLKDDKTFVSILINNQHNWPRLKLIRYKGKPKEKGLYFGPYTNAFAARQILELLSRLFPLRECSDEELKRRTRPCLLYGIKRCVAPCVDFCSKEEYDVFVDSTIDFLKGKDKAVLAELRREMKKASENLEFERAGALHTTIGQIEHVTSSRQVVQKAHAKDSDSIGLYRNADEVILMQLFVRKGRLVGSEHYSFIKAVEDDEELISSFLMQYYKHKEEDLPQEILLPLKLKDAPAIEEILLDAHKKKIDLIAPKIGDKKGLVRLAEKNAKATFTQEKDDNELREKLLLDLSETLRLTRFPRKIECFDTSNIQGSDPVASMVTYVDGKYDKKNMRIYKLKTITVSDDYAATREVLTRRLLKGKEEDNLPDLILIDGGKGQLNIALDVFKQLDIANVDVAAVTKEKAKHTKGMTEERVFLPEKKESISFSPRSPTLFFLQKIRDSAHDQAIGFHRKRRSKRLISSALENVPGIGPTKRKRLLRAFGSFKRIQAATDEDILAIKGINSKDVEAIRKFASNA